MADFKCTNCGAELKDTLDSYIKCEYCGGKTKNPRYTKEGVKAKEQSFEENAHNALASIRRGLDETANQLTKSKRPTINFFLAVVLFCFGFFPGIAYIVIVLILQEYYDQKHKDK